MMYRHELFQRNHKIPPSQLRWRYLNALRMDTARESRRGRCLHRPGRADRFYGGLRRIRAISRADVGISPYAGGTCRPCADLRGTAVGDDAYIVPAGQTGFTEICGESAPFPGLMWASAPTIAARAVHVPTCAEGRRGRCLHRPGRTDRFYGGLRRIRTISWADVGISPYAGGMCHPCAESIIRLISGPISARRRTW